jgi:hypothetical protein
MHALATHQCIRGFPLAATSDPLEIQKMSRRLLLPLLIALFACLGSECSGSSSSKSSSNSAAAAGVSVAKQEVQRDFEAPVPEPSAAIVFGLGLLAAGVVLRLKR